MKSSRLLLIDYLRAHRVATSSELSRILHITPADVRHHLSVLSQQGIVITFGNRLTHQKGRPAKLFALSEQMARNNLDLLAHHLLTLLSGKESSSDYQDLLKAIAASFADYSSKDTSSSTQKFYEAIKHLRELNYDATWEAHFRSPRVILGHCPYIAILDRHPEMCIFDSYLIELLVGKSVRQIEKLSTATRDLPYCVFILQEMNT